MHPPGRYKGDGRLRVGELQLRERVEVVYSGV